MQKNQFIAVVGFSRSGTSLISRILAEVLGVNFGEAIEHIPKNAENPDGFYENQQIMDFNERVLAQNNASVTHLPAPDFLLNLPAGALEALAAQAKNLLSVAATNRPSFGFKDPRLCLTLPLWRLAAPTLKTIIIVRSPWGALQSFSAQMHRPLHELEPLWFEYQHRILLNTAGAERFMLSFERLLSHPLETVCKVADYLGIKHDAANWEKQLAQIVKPNRVANLAPKEPFEFSPHFQAKTKLAYTKINDFLSVGAQPDYAALGALFQGLRGYEAAYVQPITAQIAAQITKLDEDLKTQISFVITRDNALQNYATQLQQQDANIALLDKQLHEHSTQLADHIQMVQQRDATLIQRDATLKQLEQTTQASQTHQQLTAAELAALQLSTSNLATKLSTSAVLLAKAQGEMQIAQRNEASAQARAAALAADNAAIAEEKIALQEAQAHLGREVVALAATIDEMKLELHDFQQALEKNSAANLDQQSSLTLQGQEGLAQHQSASAQYEIASAQQQRLIEQHENTIAQLTALLRLHATNIDLARKKNTHRDAQPSSTVLQIKQLIAPPKDLWPLVSGAYAAFKTELQTSIARQRGCGLFVGQSIAADDALVYEITPESRSISEIHFILDDDIRINGALHLELLSPAHALLAQSEIALNTIGSDGVAAFKFALVSLAAASGEHFTLRLFTKHAPDPVRLYEMQKRSNFGHKIAQRYAFILAA